MMDRYRERKDTEKEFESEKSNGFFMKLFFHLVLRIFIEYEKTFFPNYFCRGAHTKLLKAVKSL